MSRTLTFDLISDSRFGGSEAGLHEMKEQVLKRLGQLPTVQVDVGHAREYHFTNPKLADFDKCTSWRVRFWVNKERATTWNQVYSAVNEVYAPHYKFLS